MLRISEIRGFQRMRKNAIVCKWLLQCNQKFILPANGDQRHDMVTTIPYQYRWRVCGYGPASADDRLLDVTQTHRNR